MPAGQKAYEAWSGNPPNILTIAMSMPDAPYLPLTGGGTTRASLDSLLADLRGEMESEGGRHYGVQVWGSEGEEADIYTLRDWEVCRPESGMFEAVVILYYSPINTYLTLKKHMGDDLANEYLEEERQRDRLTEYCEQLLVEYEEAAAIASREGR